jgi:hypothetical protein
MSEKLKTEDVTKGAENLLDHWASQAVTRTSSPGTPVSPRLCLAAGATSGARIPPRELNRAILSESQRASLLLMLPIQQVVYVQAVNSYSNSLSV